MALGEVLSPALAWCSVTEACSRGIYEAMQHPHILIAEDSQHFWNLLVDLFTLRMPDAQLSIVADGASALLMYQAAGADCLITDWQMPELDGITLTATLRAQGAMLPVVLISRERTCKRAALAAGVNAYVAKDRVSQELLATVQALLSQSPPSAESG